MQRSRRLPEVRQKNSVRLRQVLQPVRAVSFFTVPRIIGGAILVLAALLIAIGAATAHEFSAKDVTVAHTWARATPGGSHQNH